MDPDRTGLPGGFAKVRRSRPDAWITPAAPAASAARVARAATGRARNEGMRLPTRRGRNPAPGADRRHDVHRRVKQVQGAALDLVVDAPEVLADDPEED